MFNSYVKLLEEGKPNMVAPNTPDAREKIG